MLGTLEEVAEIYKSTFVEYIDSSNKDWCATVPTCRIDDGEIVQYRAYVVLVDREKGKTYCVSVFYDLIECPELIYEYMYKKGDKEIRAIATGKKQEMAKAFLIEGLRMRTEEYQGHLGEGSPREDYLEGLNAFEKYFCDSIESNKGNIDPSKQKIDDLH